ncbi:MAG TPA: hypothetical protein VIX86_00920 [Streptosporangiaceae bacterium]
MFRPVPTSWQRASARMCDRGYLDGHCATAERPLGGGGIQAYTLVVFESEEKARASEWDPRRQERLQAVRAALAEVLAGPVEFVDLTVADEWTG